MGRGKGLASEEDNIRLAAMRGGQGQVQRMKSPQARGAGAGSDRVVVAALFLCVCAFNFVLLWAQRDKLAYGWADFRSSYSEGILYRGHPASEMYDYSLQAEIQNRLFPKVSVPGIALAYDHPPYELGIFLPFSYLPYAPAYYLWVSLTVLLAIIARNFAGAEFAAIIETFGGLRLWR